MVRSINPRLTESTTESFNPSNQRPSLGRQADAPEIPSRATGFPQPSRWRHFTSRARDCHKNIPNNMEKKLDKNTVFPTDSTNHKRWLNDWGLCVMQVARLWDLNFTRVAMQLVVLFQWKNGFYSLNSFLTRPLWIIIRKNFPCIITKSLKKHAGIKLSHSSVSQRFLTCNPRGIGSRSRTATCNLKTQAGQSSSDLWHIFVVTFSLFFLYLYWILVLPTCRLSYSYYPSKYSLYTILTYRCQTLAPRKHPNTSISCRLHPWTWVL